MTVPEVLLSLAPPNNLIIHREDRYDGSGFSVSLSQFAPEDISLLIPLYQTSKKTYDLWLYMKDSPNFDLMRRQIIEEFGSHNFLASARAIGTATYALGTASPLLRKVIHDIRSGSLTCLTGCATLLKSYPQDLECVHGAIVFARDQAKMMRNAIIDLDPVVRDADESLKLHHINDFVQKWHGALFNIASKKVKIEVNCSFTGSITNRCLENSAIDRTLYNYINNAARFAANDKVRLTIFPVGQGLVRWVIENYLTPEQQAWLQREVGPNLNKLFYGGFTRGGHGLGLSSCADFVMASFGVPTLEETLDRGYLGAKMIDQTYYAWFHWPAYLATASKSEEFCACVD